MMWWAMALALAGIGLAQCIGWAMAWYRSVPPPTPPRTEADDIDEARAMIEACMRETETTMVASTCTDGLTIEGLEEQLTILHEGRRQLQIAMHAAAVMLYADASGHAVLSDMHVRYVLAWIDKLQPDMSVGIDTSAFPTVTIPDWLHEGVTRSVASFAVSMSDDMEEIRRVMGELGFDSLVARLLALLVRPPGAACDAGTWAQRLLWVHEVAQVMHQSGHTVWDYPWASKGLEIYEVQQAGDWLVQRHCMPSTTMGRTA